MTAARAAGGVLWRRGPTGEQEIALVHRPRYDDWSLPKGTPEKGEPLLVTACREVLEETGIRPAVGPRLASVSYPVRTRRGGLADKVVDYWAMRAVEEIGFTPNREVDQIRWLSVAAAPAELTYPHDVEVVNDFVALPATAGLVVLVRHASAGRRSEWSGPDVARPLDPAGADRAGVLAGLLGWYAPDRLVSAAPKRCVQTLGPLAEALDAPISVQSAFNEDADPDRAAGQLRQLARPEGSTVVCSQGRLIPAVLAALTGGEPAGYRTAKGAAWALTFADHDLVSAEPLDA